MGSPLTHRLVPGRIKQEAAQQGRDCGNIHKTPAKSVLDGRKAPWTRK